MGLVQKIRRGEKEEGERKESGLWACWLSHMGIISRVVTWSRMCWGSWTRKGFLRGHQANVPGALVRQVEPSQHWSQEFCPIVWVGFLLSLYWRVFVYYPSSHKGIGPYISRSHWKIPTCTITSTPGRASSWMYHLYRTHSSEGSHTWCNALLSPSWNS